VNVLLVPAHPGFPGQIPQSRKTVVLCVCVCGFEIKTYFTSVSNLRLFMLLPCALTVVLFDCRPAYAVPRILSKSGLTMADIDVIEFHEAFAVSHNVIFHNWEIEAIEK